MIKKILIGFTILCTMGCSTTTVQNIPIPPQHPALPPRVILAPIEFKVITTTNEAYFALTAKNYENLSKNFNLLSEYIQNLKVIIWTYRTNDYSKTITKTNTVENPSFWDKLFRKKATQP